MYQMQKIFLLNLLNAVVIIEIQLDCGMVRIVWIQMVSDSRVSDIVMSPAAQSIMLVTWLYGKFCS